MKELVVRGIIVRCANDSISSEDVLYNVPMNMYSDKEVRT